MVLLILILILIPNTTKACGQLAQSPNPVHRYRTHGAADRTDQNHIPSDPVQIACEAGSGLALTIPTVVLLSVPTTDNFLVTHLLVCMDIIDYIP